MCLMYLILATIGIKMLGLSSLFDHTEKSLVLGSTYGDWYLSEIRIVLANCAVSGFKVLPKGNSGVSGLEILWSPAASMLCHILSKK